MDKSDNETLSFRSVGGKGAVRSTNHIKPNEPIIEEEEEKEEQIGTNIITESLKRKRGIEQHIMKQQI